MEKEQLAEFTNKCLKEYIKQLKKLSKPQMTIRDFDTFLGGFMTGYSLGNQNVDVEFIKQVSDLVVKKSVAKKLKITGTARECCEIKKL